MRRTDEARRAAGPQAATIPVQPPIDMCGHNLSVSADPVVVEAVSVKIRRLERLAKAWRSLQARAIEHELEQARRLHVG